jgi:hypothetical protein
VLRAASELFFIPKNSEFETRRTSYFYYERQSRCVQKAKNAHFYTWPSAPFTQMCLDARVLSENIPLHSQTQSTRNSTGVDEIKHYDFTNPQDIFQSR